MVSPIAVEVKQHFLFLGVESIGFILERKLTYVQAFVYIFLNPFNFFHLFSWWSNFIFGLNISNCRKSIARVIFLTHWCAWRQFLSLPGCLWKFRHDRHICLRDWFGVLHDKICGSSFSWAFWLLSQTYINTSLFFWRWCFCIGCLNLYRFIGFTTRLTHNINLRAKLSSTLSMVSTLGSYLGCHLSRLPWIYTYLTFYFIQKWIAL